MKNQTLQNLTFVKAKAPLIHNPIMSVISDFITNGLLAIGATPIVTNADYELKEMIRLSSSVVLNIETINHENKNMYSKAADR